MSNKGGVNFWIAEQRNELLWLFAFSFSAMALAKATFYRESLQFLVPFVAKLFLIFVVPGYVLFLFARETIPFSRRLVLGIGINLGLLLALSYTLGMVGIHLRYHHLIIPPLITILGVALFACRAKLGGFALFQTYDVERRERRKVKK